MTSRRSQVWLISDRMWLDRSTVCAPRSLRIIDRISTICTGSSPLVGFVQDQQLRVVHQRLGHADALAIAVRQAADQLVVHVAGAGLLLGLDDVGGGLVGRHTA